MNSLNKHRIIITPGEPAGIGPDIIIMLAQKTWPIELVICSDKMLIKNRALQLKLPIKLHPYKKHILPTPRPARELTILHINTKTMVKSGTLNPMNSRYVLKTIRRACQGCLKGEFSAMITGPVNKRTINDAGISFQGHTEFLAKNSGNKKVIMMLLNKKLRVALATTHIPILKVSKNITNQLIHESITILVQNLKQYFNIPHPTIYVCGLNPHAGENGYIGKEEIKIIIPTLNLLRAKGYNLIGPLPADTIFQKKYLKHADAILAMYHDQGLPVLKYSGFGHSINITLGLPFIRTSVDHGTAIELAGSASAIKTKSMEMAIKLAIKMIK